MVIPNSVTSIGGSAFRQCYGLTSVEIPNSITSIGESTFAECSNLKSVEIPNSVTEIGAEAFANCASLKSVVFPNSVTSIGERAFYGARLRKAVIGSSVAEIGEYAFGECSKLEEIISRNTTPPAAASNSFDKVPVSTCVLSVPDEAVEAYKAAPVWKDFDYLFTNNEGQKGIVTVKVSGKFDSFAGYRYSRIWVYGEDPETEPPFTPGAWDSSQMRFSDNEGKHFPYLSDDAYWDLNTLVFKITDISDDASLRVFNGWWSATYADGISLKDETKDDIWTLQITKEIAQDCARGGGGMGKDLQLMLTSGTATFHSVYYDEDSDEFFTVAGEVDETIEVDIFNEKQLHLVGSEEDKDIDVTLDGQPVVSDKADKFDAIITIKAGSELVITGRQGTAISAVCSDPKDWKLFNLQGQRVGDGYKGIVIQNGKKILRK